MRRSVGKNVEQLLVITMMRSRLGGCSSGSVAAYNTAVKHILVHHATGHVVLCMTARQHSQLCARLSPADRVGGVWGRGALPPQWGVC